MHRFKHGPAVGFQLLGLLRQFGATLRRAKVLDGLLLQLSRRVTVGFQGAVVGFDDLPVLIGQQDDVAGAFH